MIHLDVAAREDDPDGILVEELSHKYTGGPYPGFAGPSPQWGDGEDHGRQSHHELARLMSPRRRSAGEPGPPGRSRRIGGTSFGTGVDRRRRPRQIVRSQHAAGAGRGYARGGTRSWSTSVSVSHVSYRSGGQPRSTTSSPYTSGDTRAWMISPASRSRSVGRNARARASARATRPWPCCRWRVSSSSSIAASGSDAAALERMR